MYQPKTLFSKKFSASDIKIECLPNAVWTTHPVYDGKVREAWKEKERLAHNAGVEIWDGIQYRVMNVSEIEDDRILHLKLGIISYRYVATFVDLLPLHQQYGVTPLYHLSTTAIIRTSDGVYIFGKRRKNGTIDLIGGGAQPDEFAISSGIDLEKNVIKEITEETGIEQSSVTSLQGLGIVQSTSSNILLVFFVELTLSQQQTVDAFTHRAEDEMSELVFVPGNNIRSFLKSMNGYRPLIADLL